MPPTDDGWRFPGDRLAFHRQAQASHSRSLPSGPPEALLSSCCFRTFASDESMRERHIQYHLLQQGAYLWVRNVEGIGGRRYNARP